MNNEKEMNNIEKATTNLIENILTDKKLVWLLIVIVGAYKLGREN